MATTDDFPSDKSTTGVLQPGSTTSANFEASADNDWFKVTLAANTYYTFELNAPSITAYSGYFSLALFPAIGSSLSSLESSSTFQGIKATFKTVAAGDYYVSAANSTYQISTPYLYTIKTGSPILDVVGDTSVTATTVALGQVVNGAFEGPADTDVYKVKLVAGTTYAIKPTWLGSSGGTYLMSTSVTDSLGQNVNTGSSSSPYSFTAANSGDYFIATRGSNSTAGSAYTLQVSSAPDDYKAGIAGAGTLAVGNSAKGKLEVSGDKDWYAVTLLGGTSYWFSTKPDTSSNGAYSGSTKMSVYDSGSQLMVSASGYEKTILPFTPAKSGTYYFEVAPDSYSGSTGAYLASVVLGQRDDYGNDNGSASPLSVDSTISGKLEIASDQDVFKIEVKEGNTYLFELKTVSSVDSPSMLLIGRNASGSNAGLTDYYKPDTADYQVYRATYTGDYFLTVDNSSTYGTAAYTLQVSSPATDDYRSDAGTTGVLPMDGKVGGTIDYIGDTDWLKVHLVTGNNYAFVLDGAASGGGTLDWRNSNVSLELHTAKGGYEYFSLNAMNGLSGKGYTFRAETTGDYYLGVATSSYSQQQPKGSYTLSAYNVSGDSAMPTVASFAPGNGSSDASLTGNIVVTFNDMIRGGNGDLRLIDALGNQVESFNLSYSDGNQRIRIHDNVLTIDPTANLQAGMNYTLEMPAGSVQDFAGNKFLAKALYSFTTLNTVAQGTNGNDYLGGSGMNQRLDGGAGVDTVVYTNPYSFYNLSRGSAETKVLYRNGGSAIGDTLLGVERLQFADRNIALDADGNGGQAYRLYQAAFNRAPDVQGLGFWISALDKGVSLASVANDFINSSEFQGLYGSSASNEAFIAGIYKNVLHRDPDVSGMRYWLDAMQAGTTRGGVLIGFSESTENQAVALQLIGNGFEYTPYG